MIPTEQWRASIGSFAIRKEKQAHTEVTPDFNLLIKEAVNDNRIWNVSWKVVLFACIFSMANFSLTYESQKHPAVIQSLLIRSGIEQNPGPSTPSDLIHGLLLRLN